MLDVSETTFRTLYQSKAPSVFAQEPFGGMSGKYRFIPTFEVVRGLLAEGFQVASCSESRVRRADKRGFARHMLRLRQPGLLPQVGDLIPEIVLTNSHDGSTAFQLSAGVYRLVCSNGMTAGGDSFTMRQKHSGSAHDVIDAVFKVVDEIPQVLEQTRAWSSLQLSDREQLAFARAALPLRFEVDEHNNSAVEPSSLLRIRRTGDSGHDLFSTFNRVQENFIKGGVPRTLDNSGRTRRSQAVKSVSEDQRLNKALWTLTNEFAKMKSAA